MKLFSGGLSEPQSLQHLPAAARPARYFWPCSVRQASAWALPCARSRCWYPASKARRSGPGPESAKQRLETDLDDDLPLAMSPDSLFAMTPVAVCPAGMGSTGAYCASAGPNEHRINNPVVVLTSVRIMLVQSPFFVAGTVRRSGCQGALVHHWQSLDGLSDGGALHAGNALQRSCGVATSRVRHGSSVSQHGARSPRSAPSAIARSQRSSGLHVTIRRL